MLVHRRKFFLVLTLICLTRLNAQVLETVPNPKILSEEDKIAASVIGDLFYTYYRSLEIPKSFKRNFYDVGLYNRTIWMASCGRKYENGRNCSLTVNEINPGSRDSTKICKFQLVANHMNFVIMPYLRVYRISDEKYLVIWILQHKGAPIRITHVGNKSMEAATFVKLTIINSSDCTTYESNLTKTPAVPKLVDLNNLKNNLTIHLAESRFSVFYPYSESHDYAQEMFDDKCERLYGPVGENELSSPSQEFTMASYLKDIESKKCFTSLRSQEKFRVVTNVYEEKPSPKPLRLARNAFHGYSTTNGNLSSCKIFKNDVYSWDCSQGDSEETKVDFTISFNYQTDIFMIYNMPKGGLLTLTNGGTPYSESYTPNTIYLTRFDTSGRAYKPVRFVDIECTHSALFGQFFRDKIIGTYCLSFLWKQSQFENLINCYPEERLTERSRNE
ncbi:hypothetical protein QAD02_008585 [Eretmocerus hayati]|uniref:Uncharacterized protein n=1 Tax=Eretmocerus hayati TaxID=131215 RepID=A0ACC2N702_9HYME|nr:hypothetical protein QAD02_008585 [Eretmocerus hayati]